MLSELIAANFPWIMCLIVGFVLVVVEMYIPGFGAPGIVGSILLIVGVSLRAKNAVEALVMTVVIVALLCIVLSVSIRSASKGRFARSKLVQHEVSLHDNSAASIDASDLGYFVGEHGLTKTVLRPSGIGEFKGVRLNVVSDGEFISKDTQVRIERVEGNRIVVATVSEKPKNKA